MRTRYLKPGFFKNHILAKLEPLARILFEGLWLMADREGRLKDYPERIKAEILPYDNCEVDEFLGDLNNNGFIIRYSNSTNNYIQITNFHRHQYPHKNEPPSTIPAPSGTQEDTPIQKSESHERTSIQESESSHTPPSQASAKSVREGIKRTRKDKKRKASICTSDDVRSPEDFLIFWDAYPKKVGKQRALKAWKKLIKEKKLPDLACILDAIREQKTWTQWREEGGKYIPHPATWLNDGRWDDKPTEPMAPPEKTRDGEKLAW